MVDACTLTRSLGGRWHGRYGTAPCPVCQPERRRDQTALTLANGRDGRLLAHCKRAACDFRDIAAAAGLRSGDYRGPDPAETAQREAETRAEAEKKARQAERLWHEAQPIEGTPAARYLRETRGLAPERLPGTLRFHPECWHGATARRLPAMVARVEGGDGSAVHRTYLRADGLGKAPIEPAKAMLGTVAGGAVRLTDGPGPLLAGEGIETTLATLSLRGDETARAWAALSTSGLRSLRLPSQPGRLCIAPDGDAPALRRRTLSPSGRTPSAGTSPNRRALRQSPFPARQPGAAEGGSAQDDASGGSAPRGRG
jgi:hypothetical protein